MLSRRFSHRTLFAALFLCIGAVVAATTLLGGCGGGSSPQVSTTAPTAATRARVASLTSASMRTLTQVGFSPSSPQLVAASNGAAITPSVGGATEPQIGAFLRYVAAVPATTRAVRIRRHVVLRRDEATPTSTATSDPVIVSPPIIVDPLPTFYYDYYLGLWTQITQTDSGTTYSLFVDEAKTQPAGSIVTIEPVDETIYPQIYSSTYSFTAGYLAGSHGSSINTDNADGSGSAQYSDTYTDGSSDSGASSWSGLGDESYQSRTDTGTGQWSEARGTYRSDGSGGSSYTTSDGYTATYIYNADGSGHGTITGPDPGLPVTINWDAYGNTTIIYADGSIDTIPGWSSGGGGVATPVTTSSGTATSSTSTSKAVKLPGKK